MPDRPSRSRPYNEWPPKPRSSGPSRQTWQPRTSSAVPDPAPGAPVRGGRGDQVWSRRPSQPAQTDEALEPTLTIPVRTLRALAVAVLGLLAMTISLWRWDPPVVRVPAPETAVPAEGQSDEVGD